MPGIAPGAGNQRGSGRKRKPKTSTATRGRGKKSGPARRSSPRSTQGRLINDTDKAIQRLASQYKDALDQRMEWGAKESTFRDLLHDLMKSKKLKSCPVSIKGKEFICSIPPVEEKVFVRPAKEQPGPQDESGK